MSIGDSNVQAHLERRAGQRFDFQMPVSIRSEHSQSQAYGFTQNLSARGALVYTDIQIGAGEKIEIGLVMPSEITLTEPMRVLCRGTVLRVSAAAQQKIGVAVRLENYEYLPEARREETAIPGEINLQSADAQDDAALSAHVFSRRSTWL